MGIPLVLEPARCRLLGHSIPARRTEPPGQSLGI
jgi:hypothetical protein